MRGKIQIPHSDASPFNTQPKALVSDGIIGRCMYDGDHICPSLPGRAERYQDATAQATALPPLPFCPLNRASAPCDLRPARNRRFLDLPQFLCCPPAYKIDPRRCLEATMKYATVMVGLVLGQSNEARLEIAGQLAERFGARVIGVAAAEFSPPLYFT